MRQSMHYAVLQYAGQASRRELLCEVEVGRNGYGSLFLYSAAGICYRVPYNVPFQELQQHLV